MRHLFGIVAGLALAAALFFGGGWGFERLFTMTNFAGAHLTSATSAQLTSTRGLTSLAALLGTGLLLGVLLAAPRLSPLATAVPGVAALAATALYVVSPHRALDLIPMKTSAAGLGTHALLVTGVYGLLGLAMLVPLFVPSRWRRRPFDEEDEPMGMAAASSYLS
jgi:hypothetical protein